MSPILVQNTTEVAKLSSSANIISRPLVKMRARPATTQRCTLARDAGLPLRIRDGAGEAGKRARPLFEANRKRVSPYLR